MPYRTWLAACCLLAAAACADQPTSPDAGAPLAPDPDVPQLSKIGAPVRLGTFGDSRFVVPGAYNVVFKKGVKAKALTAHFERTMGIVPSHQWDEEWITGFAARIEPSKLERLRWHPQVAYINPVRRGRLVGTQFYPWNWGLDRIDQRARPLNEQYVYADSAPNVNVYVVDSGIQYSHYDFEGRAAPWYDVNGGTGEDCLWHGTFVAAIVGGREYGVAKRARLHSLKVTRNCVNGDLTSSDVISAVNQITRYHTKPAVANLSLVFDQQVPEVDQAVSASIQAGVTYVVAAGNQGADACNYSPAHTLGTITVGATDSTDTRWVGFGEASNYGPCLNLFAPGAQIESAFISDPGYTVASGTSFAAPHVAGIAANYLGRNRTATPSTVKSAIVNGATTSVVKNLGTGSPNRLAYSRI